LVGVFMADSDAQLELKKRARRRLVGAVALALAAAIILPIVMDSAPKPTGNDLQIRIPSQEGGNYASRLITGAPPAPPTADEPEEVDGAAARSPAAASSAPVATASETVASRRGAPVDGPRQAPRYAEASGPLVAPPSQEAPPARVAPVAPPPPQAAASASSRSRSSAASVSRSSAPATVNEGARARAILEGTGTEPAATASSKFYVQLGVYRDAENAKSVLSRAKAAGFAASTEHVGESTRVRAGPFANRQAADSAQGKLKQVGLTGVVVAK
jgi:DedD protein